MPYTTVIPLSGGQSVEVTLDRAPVNKRPKGSKPPDDMDLGWTCAASGSDHKRMLATLLKLPGVTGARLKEPK